MKANDFKGMTLELKGDTSLIFAGLSIGNVTLRKGEREFKQDAVLSIVSSSDGKNGTITYECDLEWCDDVLSEVFPDCKFDLREEDLGSLDAATVYLGDSEVDFTLTKAAIRYKDYPPIKLVSEDERERALKILGLDEDSVRDIAIRSTEILINAGYANADEDDESYDPNAPYSFLVQDVINEQIKNKLGL